MRTLEQALFDHELITLRVIAEWWELDLTGADKGESVKQLAKALQRLDLSLEMRYLPPEESEALQALIKNGGRVPVATYARNHGQVRLMGPGRLEREEPWFEPSSPAEALWYRGFLYRAFDESGDDMVEFYYLPTELFEQVPQEDEKVEEAEATPAGELAPTTAPSDYNESITSAIDDLTTILGYAQRHGWREGQLAELGDYLVGSKPGRDDLLIKLAWEAKYLRKTDDGGKPTRSAVAWMQKGREGALYDLAQTWWTSAWNELHHTRGLQCEGSGWQNDPVLARNALLNALPRNENWYHIDDIISQIKANNPDFQRPDGNYDTWYIRDVTTNDYITGFENWDLVEGRLLAFILTSPMVWLGLTEATSKAYRLTPRALAWLSEKEPKQADVPIPFIARPDGTIIVPHNANRYHRFQVARIADAERIAPHTPYTYQLTPSSLTSANEQGINPDRILQFLQQATGKEVPAGIKRAIQRWAENGTEGRLEQVVVLRVKSADILDKLQASPKTRPFLGQRLGDLAVEIRGDDWRELQKITAQLGLLLEIV